MGETLEDESRAAWCAGQMCRTDVTVSHTGFFGNRPPPPHPSPLQRGLMETMSREV